VRPPKNVSPQGIAFEASFFSQLYATTPSILGQDIFYLVYLVPRSYIWAWDPSIWMPCANILERIIFIFVW